ncbi:MAG: phage head-tail connector protein [bacterium]
MVTLADLKEVLGIDLEDNSQDHYLQNLIRRASFRISSACNRQLEYSELIEYFSCNNSNKLYLKNWPVWEILELQRFNPETSDYEDIITSTGDTIANSVYIYEGRNGGLIRLLKNYAFGISSTDIAGLDYSIRIKYRAGYKNITGTGFVSGKAGTVEISGEGTLFETEFRMGDRLVTGNYEYIVSEIVSDTSLNLSCNSESSFEEESFRIDNIPPDLAEGVLMLAAGSYLMKKYEAYGIDQKTENILSVSYNQIQQVVESSNLTPNVKMRLKEFDLSGVVDAYRRVNV